MLEEIKGLGPKTIMALEKLNIHNSEDLLTYYPYKYNIYKPELLNDQSDSEQIVLNGYIDSEPRVYYIKRNLNKLSFKFRTNSKLINVTIFNRGYLKLNLKINGFITIIGKYTSKSNSFMASDIKLQAISNIMIEPIYHLSNDIKRNNFRKIIKTLINKNYYVVSNIPEYLIKKYNLLNKLSSIKEIHNPTSLKQLKEAKVSLIYEELFSFMLKINYLKLKNKNINHNVKNFAIEKVTELKKNLPFTLTNDQVNVIDDIYKDFNSPKRMNRLILGDVGSGKTIVSFFALYMNYLAGYNGILMTPTEILANQHYHNFLNIFKNYDISCALLTSSTSKKDRNIILEKIKNNKIDILIGTHSVLNDEIDFKNLGLVITDEQHRFGVNQRKILQEKGKCADVIYMSATPIPRTLALTIYGDMDISEIKTKPGNRKEIKTKVIKPNDIRVVLNQMLEEIKQNHQIYIIAPLIEDENESNMESINKLYEKINTAFNGKVPIGLLHGKLKSKEKDAIMNDFKNNKIKILISTTVIEVGVDVENATMMVIFNAERFGLATLHQLRGRIGRNDLESKCYLISDYDIERLKVLEESNDGFYISQKDFELRGTGDLFGVKQSGDMEFKIANLNNDYKILLQCKKDSEEFLDDNLVNIAKFPAQKAIIDKISFID